MLAKIEKREKLFPATREEWEKGLTDFVNALKAAPAKEEVQVNKFADGALFIPIGTIEEKLDYYFQGMWKTTDIHYSVVVNEIVMTLQLHVLHPFSGMWLERSGTAAVQIQLRAEYEVVDGKKVKKAVDVLDVSKKIANTLTKDFPHVKAEAIKNAAKSLGNIFGRNLNRGPEDTYTDIQTIDDAELAISGIEDQAELVAFYKSLPATMRSDKRIKHALKAQELVIKAMKDEA